jgi:hypothetical protein
MKPKLLGRRDLLRLAAAGLAVSSATFQVIAAPPCASPDAADAGLRQSLHYVEAAANPAQRCNACSFFSDPKGSCGQCAIFNGPTNVEGHCDSWAART